MKKNILSDIEKDIELSNNNNVLLHRSLSGVDDDDDKNSKALQTEPVIARL